MEELWNKIKHGLIKTAQKEIGRKQEETKQTTDNERKHAIKINTVKKWLSHRRSYRKTTENKKENEVRVPN